MNFMKLIPLSGGKVLPIFKPRGKEYFLTHTRSIYDLSKYDTEFLFSQMEYLVLRYKKREKEVAAWLSEIANKTSEEAEFRCFAIKCFGHFILPNEVQSLFNCLTDKNYAVRATAIRTIGSDNDSRIFPILVQSLRDPSPTVQVAAIKELGTKGGLEVYKILLAKKEEMRGSECKYETVEDALDDAIEKTTDRIYGEILNDLKFVTNKPYNTRDLKETLSKGFLLKPYLENYGEQLVRSILGKLALHERSTDVRSLAMKLLKELGTSEGMDTLISTLETEKNDPYINRLMY